MFDRTSLIRYSGTITELVRLLWMLKSLLMIVTATCCIAFYDNVYLQHLATMSTFQIKHLPMLFSQVSYDDLWNSSRWILDVFIIYYRGTTHTKTKQSYTQWISTWRTVKNQKTRHGLAHAVHWFLEICLTQLHSRTADSCSWTSQDSEVGGRIVESLEAISCQDRRLLQIRWGQIQEMIYPLLTVVGIISQVMTDGLFFFFPAYSPASKTKTDRFIYQLIRQTDRQMERLTPVSVIMGTWDKDRLQWKETSSCLSLSLLIFFFSEDIDEQTPCSKNPVAPWDFPNHCCWETQNINFIWTLKPHKFCTSVFFWLGYEKKKNTFWVWTGFENEYILKREFIEKLLSLKRRQRDRKSVV